MKNGFVKFIILAVSIALVISIASGCQKQTTVTQKGSIKPTIKAATEAAKVQSKQTSDKSAKTMAAENIELKKQLAAKDKEIAQFKAALAKSQEEREAVKKEQEQNEGAEDADKEIMKMFEENIKLQEEVKNLQKQIEELKAGNKPN